MYSPEPHKVTIKKNDDVDNSGNCEGAGKWRKSVDDNTEVGLMIVKFIFRNSRCLKADEDAQ